MDFIVDELCSQLKMSRQQAETALGALEIIPFEHNGEVTGAAVLAGNEIHFVSRPSKRGRVGTRKDIHLFLTDLFKKYDFLTTRIPKDTPKRDRTGERMGFTPTWSDNTYDYYILTELPYVRKSTAE